MIQVINRKDSGAVFDTVRQSIKTLAGVHFSTNTVFMYNNGARKVACTVELDVITLMTYND